MNRLRQELIPISTNEVRRRVVVQHGLGGIGKSQLSAKFARKNRRSYSAIFWIDGSTKNRLKQIIADYASRLPQNQISNEINSHLRKKMYNVDEVVNEMPKWLSQPSNNQWLLNFDNVNLESPALSEDLKAFNVEDYHPKATQGPILVTSRLSSLCRLTTDMKLNPINGQQRESNLKNGFGKCVEGNNISDARLFGYHLTSWAE